MPVRERACLISAECSRHSRAFAEVTLIYREGHRSSLNRSAIYNWHPVCPKGAGGYVMRNKLLFFCMLLAAMAVLLGAVAAVSSDRRDRIGDVVGYNVLAERVFEGSVESKPYMIEQIVYFPVRTANSVLQVQVGPKDFIERSNVKVKASGTLGRNGMPT